MNAFMQMPGMVNVTAEGGKAPAEVASGKLQEPVEGEFARALEGNMKTADKSETNAVPVESGDILHNILQTAPGIGVDLELLAGINIDRSGLAESDKLLVDSGLLKGDGNIGTIPGNAKNNADLIGPESNTNKIDGSSNMVLAVKAMPDNLNSKAEVDADVVSNKGGTSAVPVRESGSVINHTDGPVESKQTLNITNNNEFLDILPSPGQNDNLVNGKTAKISINEDAVIVARDNNNATQYAEADKILGQVENELNISRVKVSNDKSSERRDGFGNIIKDADAAGAKQSADTPEEIIPDETTDKVKPVKNDGADNSRRDNADRPMIAVDPENVDENGAKLSHAESSVEIQPVKSAGPESAISAISESARSESTQAVRESTPVKFVVPDNIEPGSNQGRQTVFIKLEPESLGTVRLTLSSQGDNIMGRMVVDSHVARSVVESNISHLIDDLASKGVQLDSFQVTVGGGNGGRHFAHGSGSESGHGRGGWSGDADDFENDQNKVVNISGRRQYIGSSGVNWLA